MEKYVIHLSERTDRMQTVDGLKLVYPDLQIFDAIKEDPGYVGLSKSFRTILEDQLKRGNKTVLTFEDDAIMLPNGKEYFEQCIETLPNDWDVLLGGAYHIHKPMKVTDKLIKARDFGGTHMVLWNFTGMTKALEHQPEFGVRPPDIDKWLIKRDMKVYICDPMVCRQSGSESSIRPGKNHLDTNGTWIK